MPGRERTSEVLLWYKRPIESLRSLVRGLSPADLE